MKSKTTLLGPDYNPESSPDNYREGSLDIKMQGSQDKKVTDNLLQGNDYGEQMGKSSFVRKSSILSGISGIMNNIDGSG